MFREQAQAQARHRVRGEGKVELKATRSLRDQKHRVHLMGVLGVMHQKFGGLGGPQAVIHSMFEAVDGLDDPASEDAKKTAEKIYIAALAGDETTLQKALEPRVRAYEAYEVAVAECAEAAAAIEARVEAERAAAEAAAKSPPKAPAKGKKGAPPAEEFVPELELGPPEPPPEPPDEPRWCIRDARGVEPLAIAASRGHTGACKLLLDARANIAASAKTCGRAALHRAAESGHVETCTALIDSKADVVSTQTNGQCALYSAAANGHAALVEYLVGVGAPVEQRDVLGVTPLIAASEAGHGPVCTQLIEAGALVDAQDDKGWSAIHYAVASGHSDVATQLVTAGAAIDATRGGQQLSDLHSTIGPEIEALVRQMRGEGDGEEDDEEAETRPYTAPP